tara:strand:+ start:109 stop:627 length:519 start_codon:yes stop_codon:yes gene_type:complete
MALVVENGSGLTTSDAFVSVADCTAYFTNRQGSTAWAASTNDPQEAAIRNATAYLGRRYATLWRGRRVNSDQSLAWPRAFITDADGFAVDSTTIPQEVIDACCEGAVMALSEDLLPDIANSGIIAEESVSVGSVRTTTKYEGGKSQIKRYRKIETLLRGLLKVAGTIEIERS